MERRKTSEQQELGNEWRLLLLREVGFFVCAMAMASALFSVTQPHPRTMAGALSGVVQAHKRPEFRGSHNDTVEYLAVNRHSRFVGDNLTIWHNSLDRSIHVSWNHHENVDNGCFNPLLWGRLNGPDLAMMTEWTVTVTPPIGPHALRRQQVVSFAHYDNSVVQPNEFYYVEIIILYCNRWNTTDDFKNACLEHPFQHRLTEIGAGISTRISSSVLTASSLSTISAETASEERANHSGHASSSTTEVIQQKEPPPAKWKRKAHVPLRPLTTRVQPSNCRMDNAKLFKCKSYTNIVAINESFALDWRDDHRSIMMDTDNLTDAPQLSITGTKQICILGKSHSERIVKYLRWVVPVRNHVWLNVKNFQVKFPSDLNATSVQWLEEYNCWVVLLGVGQWSAGWPLFYPTLVPDYAQGMRTAISTLLQHSKDSGQNYRVFVRSMHYNPLGDEILRCPARDWRSPLAVDEYNKALREVCRSMEKVTFVDTNFLMQPLWDSAGDWCHYENEAGLTEAKYLGAILLGLLNPWEPPPKHFR